MAISLLKAKNAGEAGIMKPQLTSLIDVMTILLVFLLKSFSADHAIVNIPQDMELAQSVIQAKIEESYTLSITNTAMVFEGTSVMNTTDIPQGDEKLIQPLFNLLEQKNVTGGTLIIQADKSIAFAQLKKILYTCSKAELKKYSLLVEVKS